MRNSRVLSLRCPVSDFQASSSKCFAQRNAHSELWGEDMMAISLVNSDWSNVPCLFIKLITKTPYRVSDLMLLLKKKKQICTFLLLSPLSGSGCRAGTPGSVFQRRPVLHSRFPHLCGGVHIWRVCSQEYWEGKEEDSGLPLRSHHRARATGEACRSKTSAAHYSLKSSCLSLTSGWVISFQVSDPC